MIGIKKDRCSATWIITTEDNEGFHRQINVTMEEMEALIVLWRMEKIKIAEGYYGNEVK